MRKISSFVAGLLIALSLFTAMVMQAPTTHAAARSSHWVVVAHETRPLPKAVCDRVRAMNPKLAAASQVCDVTSTLMVLRADGPSPQMVCGTCGGGGCYAQSTSWKQFFSSSGFVSFYYQQTGTFTYDGCHTPSDSGHNCTRNMSYSPGVTVANTFCGDSISGGKAYAEGDYLVAVFGVGSTNVLHASCDQNGNISDPSMSAS
ncbi:MAG: hypothetical protein ACHQ4H_08380 [Ktedonobacterales bacterium]